MENIILCAITSKSDFEEIQRSAGRGEKETRKSQKADYNRELEQMLDDRSTGKVESKDTNNFKH